MLQQNQIRDELKDEINKLNQRIQEKEQLFDLVEDDDLIEAIIYEQKALHSRYTYLIKKAKKERGS
ncbi:MAG: YaaL family protein [Oscillospiraceae bacterium]|nr:YaaL family protein [Oscillospiraceae bacterium]